MAEELILYQKIYDFVLWLYPLVNRIPKSHRPVIGRRIEECGTGLLVTVIKANNARSSARLVLQQQLSDELDCLRILIRLCKDLKFMSVKQYVFASDKVNEIGRILTGWTKTSKKKSV